MSTRSSTATAAPAAVAEALRLQRADLDSDEIAESDFMRDAERPSYAGIAAAAISNAASAPYAIAAPVGAQNGKGTAMGRQSDGDGNGIAISAW